MEHFECTVVSDAVSKMISMLVVQLVVVFDPVTGKIQNSVVQYHSLHCLGLFQCEPGSNVSTCENQVYLQYPEKIDKFTVTANEAKGESVNIVLD
jgi:hypothetical protein